MDMRGNIHEIANAAARLELEERVGKVVRIPKAELETVKAMPTAERVAWYNRSLTPEAKRERKNARKRQRAARKRNR